MTKSEEKAFREQCQFNSGFHDAQSDAENQRCQRELGRMIGRQYPLPAGANWKWYRAGYRAGWQEWRETHKRNESSLTAWLAYHEQAGVEA